MKYFITILFTIGFTMISLFSFTQNLNKDQREIKEIKIIFKDISLNKLKLPIYSPLNNDTKLTLPAYFNSYKEFLQILKYRNLDSILLEFKLLSINDRIQLNNQILKDTNRFYIQKKWFANDRILILSDSMTNNKNDDYRKFIKPAFFKDYTRCFFACYYGNVINSFFLKKIRKHWVIEYIYLNVES